MPEIVPQQQPQQIILQPGQPLPPGMIQIPPQPKVLDRPRFAEITQLALRVSVELGKYGLQPHEYKEFLTILDKILTLP